MTPEEHYAEAESLAAEAADTIRQAKELSELLEERGPFDTGIAEANAMLAGVPAAVAVIIGRGNLHAKLAEVGLQFRIAGEAAKSVAEQIERGTLRVRRVGDPTGHTTEVFDDAPNKLHDWGYRSFEPNCQKCGRCKSHQGAQCVGGQGNSTAKTCMVCLHSGKDTKTDG